MPSADVLRDVRPLARRGRIDEGSARLTPLDPGHREVNAFKFTNAGGQSRFGRFRLVPDAGAEFLTPDQASRKTADFLAAEMSERLSKGPVIFRVLVQMAEDGDDVTNATVIWPETRKLVEFGTVTLSERIDELAPERRKIIFNPVPKVDGIDPSGDPLIEVRSDVYLLSGRRRRADAAKCDLGRVLTLDEDKQFSPTSGVLSALDGIPTSRSV